MRVLVDTTIWSLALRRSGGDLRSSEQAIVVVWSELVAEGRAILVGPVRQELLSGVRSEAQFENLRSRLAFFADLPIVEEDFVEAARFFNHCRKHGITGTPVDLLICAVSSRAGLAIFSTDRDFVRYSQYLPIRLHPLPQGIH